MGMFQRVHDRCDDDKNPKEECIKWIEENILQEIE